MVNVPYRLMSAAIEFKKQGNDFFAKGDFKNAIDSFTKAIECTPEDHILYSNRSGAYASLQLYTEALNDAEKCIQLNPTWVKGYSRKGLALFKLGMIKESRETYNEGLKIEPDNKLLLDGLKSTNYGLADILGQQLMIQADKLLETEPFRTYALEDPNYRNELKQSLNRILENPETLQGKVNFSHPDHRVRQAISKVFGQQDKEEEVKVEKKVETKKEEPKENLTPDELQSHKLKNEGNEFYKQKKFQEAIERYELAIKLSPHLILIKNNLAAVYHELGEYKKVEEICLEILDKRYEYKSSFEDIAKVYNRLAACYIKQNDFDNGIKMYNKSLLEHNTRQTRLSLKEAEKARDKKIKDDLFNVDLSDEYKEKGNLLFKEMKYVEAKKEYDLALRHNPNNHILYSNRAACFMKLLEYPSALIDIDKCLEIDSMYVRGWIRKANIHLNMKSFAKAQECYRKGLSIDADNIECKRGLDECLSRIMQTSSSDTVDEAQLEQAMADPELQAMMRDPQLQIHLQKLSTNPELLPEMMKDTKIANAFNKLLAAGILKVK